MSKQDESDVNEIFASKKESSDAEQLPDGSGTTRRSSKDDQGREGDGEAFDAG